MAMVTQKLPKSPPANFLQQEFVADIDRKKSSKAIDRHKAPQAERDIAKYWAEIYRQAQSSPDKRIRLEDGFVVAANDAEFLIHLLETFGKYGTFTAHPNEGLSDMVALLRISLKSQSLMEEGISKKGAELAAVKIAGSVSTFRRIKERVLGRHPNVMKKKSEKAKRLKARRPQPQLTPLEDVFGISHPKKSKDIK
jgi:hypothetical protein